MPTNPGERFPLPTIPQSAARETRALAPLFLVALAIVLVLVEGLELAAVVVAIVAGRLSGVR